MKILVLSSYTGDQRSKPPNPITRADFSSPAHYEQRVIELTDYGMPAGKMFLGPYAIPIREGLRKIREHEQLKSQIEINHYFPSSCYRVDLGEDLVHEDDIIVPFNVEPLPGTGGRYGETDTSGRVQALIEHYDLVFSLLKEYDFLPLERVFESLYKKVPLIFLVAKSWKPADSWKCSVLKSRCVFVHQVRHIDGVSNYNYQGAVFRKLCEVARCEGFEVFEQVKQDPQSLIEIIRSP
ncbi:MAG: hypothetical protein OXN27_21520 [Candidatus Poribacteria bacterium]|nr:hypothetical protein [Candidatus Poribacteria bacterium]